MYTTNNETINLPVRVDFNGVFFIIIILTEIVTSCYLR